MPAGCVQEMRSLQQCRDSITRLEETGGQEEKDLTHMKHNLTKLRVEIKVTQSPFCYGLLSIPAISAPLAGSWQWSIAGALPGLKHFQID